MSRPSKLNPAEKDAVAGLLEGRAELLAQLSELTLKEIARKMCVSYGIVWRLNAKLLGKRSYKIRNPIAIPDVGTEDKANA